MYAPENIRIVARIACDARYTPAPVPFPPSTISADVIRETFGETDGTFVFLPEEKRDLPR